MDQYNQQNPNPQGNYQQPYQPPYQPSSRWQQVLCTSVPHLCLHTQGLQ